MIRTPRFTLALSVLLLLAPATASGQNAMGVGVRIGTLGAGGDIAVALMDGLQLRGGVGLMPIDYNGTFSDVDWTLQMPSSFVTAGLDYFPGDGGLRISAGVLYKPDQPALEGDFSGSVEIGGRTYTGAQVGRLAGTVESGTFAPFVTLGYGRMASAGIGLYVDAGVAFQSEPDLRLTASGPIADAPEFQADLAAEERSVEDDLGVLRFWPILNIGLRVGIGG